MSSSLAKWMEPEQAHAGEVRKLSTLLEASQALSSTLDLKQALHRVLEILGRHHGALRSTVVLLNDETGEVEVEAAAGAVTPGKRVRYRLGEGITGQVVQSGKPIVVPRVSREPAFLNRAADRPRAGAAGAQLHLARRFCSRGGRSGLSASTFDTRPTATTTAR